MRKPNLKPVRSKGKTYWYYSQHGRRIRIHAEPGTPEFDAEYWAIRSGRKAKPTPKTTWAELVKSYRASARFQRLAPGTKRKYNPVLDQIAMKNGDRDVTRTRRSDVVAVHEKYADTPRKADLHVQVLSILFGHAIRLEWTTHNPASGVDKFGPRRSFEPWPEWFQTAYVAEAHGAALSAFFLGAGTGQRPGDVCKMEWGHFDGEYMRVVQDKTDERIEVYCPLILREYLAGLKREGRFILARDLTRPMTYSALEKQFRAVRARIAEERPEALAYSLHGLRVLAAVELAETGAADAEIQAVLGHRTAAMAAKYRRRASRKALTIAAQRRREK